MKLKPHCEVVAQRGRAPHGARGLKQFLARCRHADPASRPARGAWIETIVHKTVLGTFRVAPRTGRVD